MSKKESIKSSNTGSKVKPVAQGKASNKGRFAAELSPKVKPGGKPKK